jgi:hypothetical protein
MITSIYKEAVRFGLNSFEYGGIFPECHNARLNGILMEQAVNLDVNLKKECMLLFWTLN